MTLKKYFIRFKPFLIFIGSFFLAYLILTVVYQKFLNSFEEHKIDSFTRIVSNHTELLLSWYDADANIVEAKSYPYFLVYYHQTPIARIVEGCNAISVIILFVSFITAFPGKLKNMVLFIGTGSMIIYVLNIFRIALLTVLMYKFPEQHHFLHSVFFPLFIYGIVFILWLIWVQKFSRYA